MRYDIRFRGRVQGVGFRATARSLALAHDRASDSPRFRVVGWVRNEPDGDVSMSVEGESDAVDAYLADLRAALGSLIRRETIAAHPGHLGYESFEIRH